MINDKRSEISSRATIGAFALEALEHRRLMANSAGIPDPTFNGGTLQEVNDPPSGYYFAYDSTAQEAISPNGNIIVVRSGYQSGNSDSTAIIVVQFNPDGTPDTSFANQGYDIIANTGSAAPNIAGVAVNPDLSIVIAANEYELSGGTTSLNHSSYLYNVATDGSVAFQTTVFDNYSYDVGITAMTLAGNGCVAIVGFGQNLTSDDDGGPAEYAAEEYVGETLQPVGTVDTPAGPAGGTLYGVTPGPTGSVYICGGGENGPAYLARLNSSGNLDTTFQFTPLSGSNLKTTAVIQSVAVAPSGEIVISYSDSSGPNIVDDVARLTSSGVQESSFGNNGAFTLPSSTDTRIENIAVQSDSKIVVTGYVFVTSSAGNGAMYDVIRLTASGALDSSFGTTSAGTEQLGVSGQYNYLSGTAIDGDGRILLIGETSADDGNEYDIQMIRVLPGEYAYSGTPTSLSTSAATTIPAVNYDNGGEGVAYHDSDATNNSSFEGAPYFSAYRPGSGVDIENDSSGTSPHVAYTESGEYLQYSVSVIAAGVYPISLVAGDGADGAFVHIAVDGVAGPEEAIPNTGGFLNFATVPIEADGLSVGTHIIQLSMDQNDGDGFNGNFRSLVLGKPTLANPPTPQLTGTTIGTPGSYNNDGNTIAKATDGNLTTFFDGPTANGNWVGLDLGTSGGVVTQVDYASRSGLASRMNGGIFQASDSATFATGVVNLLTIASNANPSSNSLTTQAISNATPYRYYRYLSPNGSYGDIAEVQFFGTAGGLKTTGPFQLTGVTIGTAGSYKNDGNTIAKATDGNLSTFFDGPTANGNWVGLDLGTSGGVVTQIEYASRSGLASRMNGGVFQASDSATFASGVINLYSIASNANPSSSSLTTQAVSNTTPYRYYRYLSPNGSYGDVSEVQFFGTAGGLATITKLTGTTIGTSGSYKNDGNTIAKATDGNLSTFFDAASANGNWVGLDLGSSKSIRQISYAPRPGEAARMVGGEFQTSTSATFSSGVTTIYTITATPTVGSLTTITLSSPVTARYIRYLSPNGSYGDVAEVAFYG